jgi:restriction endonuclease Mrr
MDESEDPPLLHTADLMHEILRAGASGEASLDDALARVRADLAAAHEAPGVDEAELRRRLDTARRDLRVAGLIEPRGDSRFRTTERGHKVLADYPDGVDESVLARFPEFRRYIRETAGPPPADAARTPYDEGYAAYGDGAHPTDNPYPPDSLAHVSWANGWFEARDADAPPAS